MINWLQKKYIDDDTDKLELEKKIPDVSNFVKNPIIILKLVNRR